MDSSNHSDVMRLAKSDIHNSKVRFFLNELNEGNSVNVPDPWFGGYDGFQEVYKLLDRTCDNIVNKLINSRINSSD